MSFNEDRLKIYFDRADEVSDILLFVLCCRYLKTFAEPILETLEFIPEEMNHLEYVRVYFGGPEG